jgi:hypothetical protein
LVSGEEVKPGRLADGQHAEQHCVDQAEDGGSIGADAERERADDDQRKTRPPAKLTQPVAEIGGRRFEHGDAASLPAFFLDLLDAADREPGAPQRFVSRHARGDEFRRLLLAVKLQLRGELGLHRLATEDGSKPVLEVAEHARHARHGDSSGDV